jgi:CheY-like chemotaxis protein
MTWGLRIVIVEDDALIGMYLDDLLSGMGHDVRAIARTEPDAVAAASQHHPELMIVDGNLRDGSGVSAMRKILSTGFVRHFYVTGNAMAIAQAVDDAIIITKPFNLRDLQGAIAKAMQANQI